MYSVGPEPESEGHPLAPGASPAAIRVALLPADQTLFDAAYDAALGDARSSRDLTGLFRMLEHWRGLAALQSDPDAFRRVVRRAAEALTGRPSPEDEPLDVTRRKAGM